MSRYVVTGTGTGIGKTVFAAALTGALNAHYWKPLQTGAGDGTDSETVLKLTGIPPNHIVPEAHVLNLAASPHLAAEAEGVVIDPAALTPPDCTRLIIEGAGGVLVPINRHRLVADLFAQWQIPVILVCTTQLGTISHSLTALEALKARNVPLHGLAFVGDAHTDNEAIIPQLSGVRRLGRLPGLYPLERRALATAFALNFNTADFA